MGQGIKSSLEIDRSQDITLAQGVEMASIKLGIVGLGLGQWMVETVKKIEGAQVVAAAENMPARLDSMGGAEAYEKENDLRLYQDADQMMDDESLDAIALAVMPKHRRALIESAGNRGLPMLIEKPWAGNVQIGRELVELCHSFDAPCQIEFPLRCMPAMVRLRELMTGNLGKGWMANANLMMGWCPPPESKHWDAENHNGLLNECYVHLFDTLAFLLGRPKSAFSFGGSFRGSPMPDAAAAVIEFESGASASLTCGGIGAACADSGHLLDIWTENGLARISGRQWLPDTLEWALREAKEPTVERFHAPERFTLMEYNMRAFFNTVRRGDPVAATPEDGLIATAMAMAIQESIITGNRVAVDY